MVDAAVTPARIRSVDPLGNNPPASNASASRMMRSRFASVTSAETSASRTVQPAFASTCAMPPPM